MEAENLVVVVDDDERICRAVQRILTEAGYRVRTYNDALAFLADLDGLDPGCLLFDIRIPGLHGLALLAETRASGVHVPVVFITGSEDVEAAVRAMKLGAVDLLEKPLDSDVLLAAVGHATQRGEAQQVQRRQTAELWRALEKLTPREAEVGALVTSGRLNKQIAQMIGTTEKTVKVHRARAMAKLGAHSVAELVRIVDSLLKADAPTSILTDEHRWLARPSALEAMAAALGRDAQAASAFMPSGSTPARSRVSSDSAASLHSD